MTDFRARGTIMGPTGLTAVFGMGTGVTPPVWSPEIRPAGGQARRARFSEFSIAGRSRSSIKPGKSRGAIRLHRREWTLNGRGSSTRGV